MVNARLHIICGNCGSDDMFKYRINDEIDDDSQERILRVAIICENCSTIHCLEDNADQENDR